jgi:hypothetical protein
VTKRLVLVGATGMVGGYALRNALDDSDVEVVTSIARRKLGISHPKLKEVRRFRLLFPNQVTRADDLARVMVEAAVRGTPQHPGPVFENRDSEPVTQRLSCSR